MLSKEDRVLIKMLRVEKGYGAKRLMAEFPRRNLSLAAVKRPLQKIDATGSADRKNRQWSTSHVIFQYSQGGFI